METLAEVDRQLEYTIIGSEDDDVACRIDDRGTDFTVRQVAFDISADLRVERAVDVFGDVLPDVAAVQNHGSLPSKRCFRRGAATIRNCGASFFCSIMRARCRRTLTDAIEIPSREAVSLTLSSWTSRRVTISR